MSLKTLIESIGHWFAGLFNSTKDAFNDLSKEQQDAIVQGVNVSQLIKDGYAKGADFLIQEVATATNSSTDVSKAVILHILSSLGISVTDVQSGLDQLADRVQSTITDDGWNGLWESVAKFAASWLSTGSLNWVTLGLGVVEFAYQHFLKGVK